MGAPTRVRERLSTAGKRVVASSVFFDLRGLVRTDFSSRCLPLPQSSALLLELLERVSRRSTERTPVMVFDLDGTLMDNRPRVVAILHELAEEWRRSKPDAAMLASEARPERVVYGFAENMRRLGIHDEALHDEALSFWKDRFFADAHIRHDVEVPGAAAYVRACYEAGATIVYLTGRDLPNMALGSFASLRDRGFPIGVVGTELVVKPRFETPDAEFKRAVAPALSRLGSVLAVFDNEPANTNLFLDVHPSCTSVFLDTQHAPSPPPLDDRVQVIENFELVR
jgi:hypothetical protein